MAHPTFPLIAPNLTGTQGKALPTTLDPDDLDRKFLSGSYNIRRLQLWCSDHLTDVQQPFNTQIKLDKCTKIHHARHSAFYDVANAVCFVHLCPRIRQQLLAAERYPLPILVDAKHVYLNFIPDLQHIAWVIDSLPAQFGNVDQSICATQIHKCPETGDIRDLSLPYITFS